MPAERREIVFHGRVQGVGFRATTVLVAHRHPVTGWVRNERDGTVRCVVEGGAGAIDGFLDDLRRAMAGHVDRESADTGPAGGDLDGFRVR